MLSPSLLSPPLPRDTVASRSRPCASLVPPVSASPAAPSPGSSARTGLAPAAAVQSPRRRRGPPADERPQSLSAGHCQPPPRCRPLPAHPQQGAVTGSVAALQGCTGCFLTSKKEGKALAGHGPPQHQDSPPGEGVFWAHGVKRKGLIAPALLTAGAQGPGCCVYPGEGMKSPLQLRPAHEHHLHCGGRQSPLS